MARDDRDRDKGRSGYGKVDSDLMDRYRRDQESAKKRSGGGSRADWLTLKDGNNLVRILPPLAKGDPFYLYVGQHRNLGPDKKSFLYCPAQSLSMDGKTRLVDHECPVCEYVELVKKKSKKSSELEQAKKNQVKGSWICQALDRDEDDNKPRLWTMGSMIYNQVMEYLTGKYPDLYQLEQGYDLNVKRSGKELETKYQVYPEKDPSDIDEAVVDDMIDLEEYVRFRIFSVEDMERVLAGEDPMDIVNERSDTDEVKDRKAKDRERERERDEPRGRDRDDDRGRDRDRDRDEPRGRDRDEPRGRERERDDDRDRGRGRDDEPPRGRERDRDEPRGRDRDEAPRSESRNVSGRESRDRDRDDDRDRDRDRDRGRGDKYDDAAEEELARLRSESGGRSRR